MRLLAVKAAHIEFGAELGKTTRAPTVHCVRYRRAEYKAWAWRPVAVVPLLRCLEPCSPGGARVGGYNVFVHVLNSKAK